MEPYPYMTRPVKQPKRLRFALRHDDPSFAEGNKRDEAEAPAEGAEAPNKGAERE